MIKFNKTLDAVLSYLLIGCGVLFILNGILAFDIYRLIVGLILGYLSIKFGLKFLKKTKLEYEAYDQSNEDINKSDLDKTLIETIDIPTDFIILDTETTGLSPRYDDIIEIGAIKIKDGSVVDEFHTYCKPLRKINNTDIHNITNEMVESYKYSKYYMNDLIDFTERLPILIYNARFDTQMINVQLDKNIENDIVDLLAIAKKYDTRDDYKLENIKNDLNIKVESHNAIDDCTTTKLYYDYLIQKYKIKQLPLFSQNDVSEIKELKLIIYADKLLKIYTPEHIIENEHFKNKIFVFTGVLKSMSRFDAAKKVIENGGIYHPRIILKVDYLVVGYLDEETDKIRQARYYNDEKNTNIKIIHEDEFLNLLNK